MGLHADRRGTGPALVLVHGFTQTNRCWGPEAEDLAQDHEVIAVDAPGHGRSSAVAANLVEGGRLLVESAGTATYLGYSMGARLCLHAALAAPDQVRGLVLLGGTAGIEDPAERAVRREQDEARAARLRAEGVDVFLDEWLAQPIFAGLAADVSFRSERRVNTASGLASSLELAGTGTQEPLWGRLSTLTMPVLVLAGERDEKFSALGRRMATTIGANATFASVARAGHTAHLERPTAFLSVLRPWLSSHGL